MIQLPQIDLNSILTIAGLALIAALCIAALCIAARMPGRRYAKPVGLPAAGNST